MGIIELGKKLYFPDGKSSKGTEDKFSFELVDSSNNLVSPEKTILEMLEENSPKVPRIYLKTERVDTFVNDNKQLECEFKNTLLAKDKVVQSITSDEQIILYADTVSKKAAKQEPAKNCKEQKEEKKEEQSLENMLNEVEEEISKKYINSKSTNKLNPESFVIVEYENSFYPGQIKKGKDKNEGILVSTMIKSGVKDWKWPEETDELFYTKDQIKEVIGEPIKKNSRGAYMVPEMSKYEDFKIF
ncbi:unnamed protein product [Brassicogethes aeneus]|uniref:Uncharacterized protein n=1 Tax=Brassicogethes aeneus TaxID=1431903 RepID=A0A9P0FDB2_BRAAE|nr:unnamed protein product [Brassicogethes aeneus]